MRLTLSLAAAAAMIAFAAPASAETCTAAASGPWASADEGFTVEFYAASLAACGQGVTTVAVRGPDGGVIWSKAQVTAWNDFLNSAADAADLQKRLSEMADLSKSPFHKTSELPEWKDGADTPGKQRELPFFQADGVDRETYESTRAQGWPVFCFREATGYLGCYALVPSGSMADVTEIGQLRLTAD